MKTHFRKYHWSQVFVLISRDMQGSNSLNTGGTAVKERHTENTHQESVLPTRRSKCHSEALLLSPQSQDSSFWRQYLGIQVPSFSCFLKRRWSLSTDCSQGCSTLCAGPTAPVHLSVSPSVCLISPVSRLLKTSLWWLTFCSARDLAGRSPAEGITPCLGSIGSFSLAKVLF